MSDKRIQKTKKLIKQTFLDLAKHNDIQKITVKAICDNANINRCTFYYHYLDVLDLQEKLEITAADRIIDALTNFYSFNGKTSNIIDNLFLCLKEYPEDAWLLFGNKQGKTEERGLNYLYRELKRISLPQWKTKSHVNDEQLEIIFSHTVHSIFHLLKLWQNENFKMSEDEFKELYNNVIVKGIYTYIYK